MPRTEYEWALGVARAHMSRGSRDQRAFLTESLGLLFKLAHGDAPTAAELASYDAIKKYLDTLPKPYGQLKKEAKALKRKHREAKRAMLSRGTQ